MPSPRYLDIAPDVIDEEHICCAFSDVKSVDGYAAKKRWLADQHALGYRFRRLDERGKVFIEYVPATHAWLPLEATDTMVESCFWVSGRFKGHGHGRALPAFAEEAGIPCRVRTIESREQARALPIPWVIQAVFFEGTFVTLEMDSVKHLRAVIEG